MDAGLLVRFQMGNDDGRLDSNGTAENGGQQHMVWKCSQQKLLIDRPRRQR